MAFGKTWIVIIAGCGVLSLAFWNGMNAMTLKITLLWMIISFGFLTLIMYLFGSPISIVLHKLFKSDICWCDNVTLEEKLAKEMCVMDFLFKPTLKVYILFYFVEISKIFSSSKISQ